MRNKDYLYLINFEVKTSLSKKEYEHIRSCSFFKKSLRR